MQRRTRALSLGTGLVLTALLSSACSGSKTDQATTGPAQSAQQTTSSQTTSSQTPSSAGNSSPAGSPTTTPSTTAAPAVTGTQKFEPLKVGVGKYQVTTLKGAASGVSMKVYVWLPPQYDDPAFANKRFPVLLTYPGGTGHNYTQWTGFGQPELLASGGPDKNITPFIMVETQLQLDGKLETECTDLAGHPKIGTFMDTDVPAMVKENFRVLPERTAWGLAGASSGGYCAIKHLMHNPTKFAAGAALSGYFQIDSRLAAGKTAEAKATSPLAMAKAGTLPDIKFLAMSGNKGASERLTIKRNKEFKAAAKPPLAVEVYEGQGGHTWSAFKSMMPTMFVWLSKNLDKPQ